MKWMKKEHEDQERGRMIEFEITPDYILGAKEESSESKEIDIDKMKFWFPEVNE